MGRFDWYISTGLRRPGCGAPGVGEGVAVGLPARLYRVLAPRSPWVGEGSFWALHPGDVDAFRDTARHQVVVTRPRGEVLDLASDDELAGVLDALGVADAEDRVLDADWLEGDVFAVLRAAGYTWLSRPIDLNVSRAREWIYLGALPVAYQPW